MHFMGPVYGELARSHYPELFNAISKCGAAIWRIVLVYMCFVFSTPGDFLRIPHTINKLRIQAGEQEH